jgi:hypothetical protein
VRRIAKRLLRGTGTLTGKQVVWHCTVRERRERRRVQVGPDAWIFE